MAEYIPSAVDGKEPEPDAFIPTRPIEDNERWKLKKPHPSWRPDLVAKQSRTEAWLNLSENERILLSDSLGPREPKY